MQLNTTHFQGFAQFIEQRHPVRSWDVGNEDDFFHKNQELTDPLSEPLHEKVNGPSAIGCILVTSAKSIG